MSDTHHYLESITSSPRRLKGRAHRHGRCFFLQVATAQTAQHTPATRHGASPSAMPRLGIDPMRNALAANRRGANTLITCKGCGKESRNKSGHTQHTNRCKVLLEARLRAAREQLPAADHNLDDMGLDVGGGGNQNDDDDYPMGDDEHGGGMGGLGREGAEAEVDGRPNVRRATRKFHERMTGTSRTSSFALQVLTIG